MITEFKGEFRFLSNFYFATVEIDGHKYPTAEHAYQAAKTTSEADRKLIADAATAGEAKRLGQKIIMRPDWIDVRVAVMRRIVKAKFRDATLAAKLLATTGPIVETNSWNDCFWGVCRGKGKNHLGKILVEVREELREQKEKKMKIKLIVASGELVGWATIPPFKIPPDSVTWGTRVFYKDGPVVLHADVGVQSCTYREGFSFAVVTPVTEKPE